MPDIAKINAVAIADIEKVDGILAANIAKVNGLTFPAAGVAPPLDTYTGAAAAYSTRLLRTAYSGNIMRVRRNSDQNEIDVGFDSNGEFGLTSPVSNASTGSFTDFADFIGHTGTPADGFVRQWYDQSGNAADVGQTTDSQQPQIYDSVTGIITSNGKPAVDADAVDYSGFPISLGLSQPFTTFAVGIVTDALGSARLYGFAPQMAPGYNSNIYAGAGLFTTEDLRGDEFMMWAVYNSTTSKVKAISSASSDEASGNAGTSTAFTYLLRRYDWDQGNNLRANEIIFWDSEQSTSNLSGIEANLDTYYAIT